MISLYVVTSAASVAFVRIEGLKDCSTFQDGIEVAGSTVSCRGRGGQKRKLSSKDKESVPSGSEQQQPDIKDEASMHGDTGKIYVDFKS